jgi:hypothetical protein
MTVSQDKTRSGTPLNPVLLIGAGALAEQALHQIQQCAADWRVQAHGPFTLVSLKIHAESETAPELAVGREQPEDGSHRMIRFEYREESELPPTAHRTPETEYFTGNEIAANFERLLRRLRPAVEKSDFRSAPPPTVACYLLIDLGQHENALAALLSARALVNSDDIEITAIAMTGRSAESQTDEFGWRRELQDLVDANDRKVLFHRLYLVDGHNARSQWLPSAKSQAAFAARFVLCHGLAGFSHRVRRRDSRRRDAKSPFASVCGSFSVTVHRTEETPDVPVARELEQLLFPPRELGPLGWGTDTEEEERIAYEEAQEQRARARTVVDQINAYLLTASKRAIDDENDLQPNVQLRDEEIRQNVERRLREELIAICRPRETVKPHRSSAGREEPTPSQDPDSPDEEDRKRETRQPQRLTEFLAELRSGIIPIVSYAQVHDRHHDRRKVAARLRRQLANAPALHPEQEELPPPPRSSEEVEVEQPRGGLFGPFVDSIFGKRRGKVEVATSHEPPPPPPPPPEALESLPQPVNADPSLSPVIHDLAARLEAWCDHLLNAAAETGDRPSDVILTAMNEQWATSFAGKCFDKEELDKAQHELKDPGEEERAKDKIARRWADAMLAAFHEPPSHAESIQLAYAGFIVRNWLKHTSWDELGSLLHAGARGLKEWFLSTVIPLWPYPPRKYAQQRGFIVVDSLLAGLIETHGGGEDPRQKRHDQQPTPDDTYRVVAVPWGDPGLVVCVQMVQHPDDIEVFLRAPESL